MSQFRVEKRDSLSTAPELLRYLLWAVDGLGLREDLNLFQPEPHSLESFRERLTQASRRHLSSVESAPFEPSPQVVLSRPDDYFQIEEKAQTADRQAAAYVRMLAAMILAISGDHEGHRWLASMLITDHLNRKLTIARFFGLLTDQQVGSLEPRVPSRSQAVDWARQVATRDITIKSRLLELAQVREGPSF